MPDGASEPRWVTTPQVGEIILSVKGVSKRFGGTQALDDVSLDLERGKVLALLGENGAGKSTLIKILAGVYTPDEGAILFRGAKTSPANLPIAFIHQDLGLIDWMSVAENVCLSLGYPGHAGLINTRAMRRRAVEALNKLGVVIDPNARVEQLTRTEKALVAVSRALGSNADIIVMDEPTASLPASEVARLFGAIERLRSAGVAVIYVSHRLDEVFRIADSVVVLRDGRVVGRSPVEAITPESLVVQIVGREPSQVFRRPTAAIGDPRLTLSNFSVRGAGPVTCDFRSGEVVGLVGLRGAGQELIGQALFGLTERVGGEIRLNGKPIAPASPREAMQDGVSLIWGDRNDGSIVPFLSVKENLFLNQSFGGLRWFSYIAPAKENVAALDLGRKVGLRPNQPTLPIEALSGGNQQKVVVGRWLNLDRKVYVFEDPTAGVDVGAKAEIYKLFNLALENGAAIVIISTDFEEIANICHRALVFDRGQVVAELMHERLTPGALLAAASASNSAPARAS